MQYHFFSKNFFMYPLDNSIYILRKQIELIIWVNVQSTYSTTNPIILSMMRNRVGGISLKWEIPTSHTTVRTVPYTAVQST